MTDTVPIDDLNPPKPFSPPAAPDPTAKIEDETEPDPSAKPSFFKRWGIPTSIADLRTHTLRYYIVKLISWIVLLQGLDSLKGNIQEIFVIFPKIPSVYKALNFSQDIYSAIVYKSVVVTATSAIEAVFGLSLVTKQSKLIKNFHLAVGIALIVISYLLLNVLSPLNIDTFSPSTGLAMNLHFLDL